MPSCAINLNCQPNPFLFMKNSFFVIPISGKDFSLTFLSARPLSVIRKEVQMSLRIWFDGDGREINFGKVRQFDSIEALEKEFDLSRKVLPLYADVTYRRALIEYRAVAPIVHSYDSENKLAMHLYMSLALVLG